MVTMVNYRLSLLIVASAIALPWLLTTLGCCPDFLVDIANWLKVTDLLSQVKNVWSFPYSFGSKKSDNDHSTPVSASPHTLDPDKLEETASGVFTKSELSKYTGERESAPIYLAVLGQVFDVSSGRKFYGPGNPYSFFSGRDASGAFVTGDFTEKGLTDDIEGFTGNQLIGIGEWVDFYKENYKHIGYVSGKFYTNDGKPTKVLERINAKVAKFNKQQEMDKLRASRPPCNIETDHKTGTKVWCTQKSGGVLRNWVGVPRLMYRPGDSTLSCVCVQLSSLTEHEKRSSAIRSYPGCEPTSTSCKVPNNFNMDTLL
ncbi:neuferricin isoform X1 [Octopus bimaculoides]|uniref:Cytochrome b5 heme-binding domain-containing protein n=1 Tax=Octopus bimaculoides TaxID=37653 RepID=A0A0L8GRZ5_OCTBM|nr:neuferricin isoform X1 [Octopus bimaculoides]|eukprot:XP_014778686.1 PREDICTED: neuferricin-like [Octopus bimaculoides]